MPDAPTEAALDPDLPIIDPHHHLWDRSPSPDYVDFEVADMVRTVRTSGHNIVATVYLEAGSGHLTDGPAHLRLAGESAYARAAAEATVGSDVALARGIVTAIDLTLAPTLLEELLDAHEQAAGPLLRGVRQISAWDPNPSLNFESRGLPRGAFAEPRIQQALRTVAARGLSFDTWMHFHQLGDLVALADAVPDLPIILDHMGGVPLIGPYAGRDSEVRAVWQRNIDALAQRPNIVVKLGGLFLGPAKHFRAEEGSAGLADDCRPWFDHLIDRFGPHRCMFESNFPVDGQHLDYGVLWNAFKRYAAPFSQAERSALFHDVAAATYSI